VARGIEEALQRGADEDADEETIAITINGERPRKGVFEVRVGGTVVASTGPEARPFPALKALDVERVAQSAVDAAIRAGLLDC
jgi:hypothetical protein|tara:strand:- start:375 stop:623 length:249 start_codon:yes stop_codon:yes gene_type:complete